MLVTALPTTSPDMRDALALVLADFLIEGKVLSRSSRGNLDRYRFAMAGAKKVSRIQALAPDIAEAMRAVQADITVIDGDGQIEIALMTAPFFSGATFSHRYLSNRES